MMLICHDPGFEPSPLASALAQYEVASSVLELGSKTELKLPDDAGSVVLVLPRLDVTAAGEWVGVVRSALDATSRLWVCCPRLGPEDRRLLLTCGASEVISPRSFEPGAVAERLLAELTLAGEVEPSGFGAFRGATLVMREVYHRIETLAPLRESILILGETGCGKELAAREIHARSGGRGELLAINCAALTPELLESELFGHERGAFSGAERKRQGLLASAGRGTVFLDEIGDLAPQAQAKLLRVLEERRVRPVGGNSWEPISARLLFATNRPLEEDWRAGDFRQDLYERLSGFTVHLPPLRDRRADLPLLVQHFVDEYNREYEVARTVPGGVLDLLFAYDWPGNVRQLRQAVRRAAAFASGKSGPISTLHLLETVERPSSEPNPHRVSFDPATDTWQEVHDRVRARYFRSVLAQTGGQKEAAAERAGVSRSRFYEILKEIEQQKGK